MDFGFTLKPEHSVKRTIALTKQAEAAGFTYGWLFDSHVLWKDVAEIRSLAIHPDYQHLGLGSKLVDYMKEEAGIMGIKQLFTFTLTEEFFRSQGFRRQDREQLPSKVWGECSRCPKYYKCDEVGMMLELGGKKA